MTTIVVTGVKGGVGKSTISVYLSIYLSSKYKVMLVDADFLNYSSYLLKLHDRLPLKKENLKIVTVDPRKHSITHALVENQGYDYVIVDCSLYGENGCSEVLRRADVVIYVTDLSSLDMLLPVAERGESKKKVLVLNMVPPYPEDVEGATLRVRNLNFHLKVVVPFVPKIFMGKHREIKEHKVEILDRLAEAIEKGRLNGGVISPLPFPQDA